MPRAELDSAILAAASRCSLRALQALVSQGADVNARSATGQTPLMRVVRWGRHRAPTLAGWLLQQGAEVNAADRQDHTALHIAVRKQDPVNIALLLDAGANADAPDRSARPPACYAIERRSLSVLDLLLTRGADPNARTPDWPLLYWAIREPCDRDLVRCLLDHRADPDIVWEYNWVPLFAAACQRDLELVRLLLSYGASPNPRINGALSPRPLIGAVMQRDVSILQVLLEHSANPNLVEPRDGLTALLFTVVNDDVASTRLLLAAGADPTLPCLRSGETPLDIAISEGRPEIERLLREAAASAPH